ncbi:MAG: DUF429 domain-containing protein [Dehalococcoidia bacterium]
MLLALPARLFGIDFSGSTRAGRKIWLAGGRFIEGRLQIACCLRGAALPVSGPSRERCLPALQAFIAGQRDAAFGCDFPFGLPAPLIAEGSWEQFVRGFALRYPDAAALRAQCMAAMGGKEVKRRCDVESRTPFCTYNLRLYRQTHAGIAELIAPLVREDAARVLPMQGRAADRPALLEICPASTLKRLGWYLRGYKGAGAAPLEARRRILTALEGEHWFSLADNLRDVVLADPEGDALDSVIAAYATAEAFRNPERYQRASDPAYAIEGYVYA